MFPTGGKLLSADVSARLKLLTGLERDYLIEEIVAKMRAREQRRGSWRGNQHRKAQGS